MVIWISDDSLLVRYFRYSGVSVIQMFVIQIPTVFGSLPKLELSSLFVKNILTFDIAEKFEGIFKPFDLGFLRMSTKFLQCGINL